MTSRSERCYGVRPQPWWLFSRIFVLSLALYPLLGVSFFPRTDPGQFVINVKAPTGTRIELTDEFIARVEDDIREVVPQHDLGMIVSNIGITPDFSAIYTTNSGQHTAFVQVSLKEGHSVGSFEYMDRVRRKLSDDLPELSTYFQAGGLVDAVVNLGLPAPIDMQVSGSNLKDAYATAQRPCAPDSTALTGSATCSSRRTSTTRASSSTSTARWRPGSVCRRRKLSTTSSRR